MKKNYNKLIIALSVFIVIGVVYSFFSNELGVQAADSSLVSTNMMTPGISASTMGIGNDKISKDTSFLYALTSLTRLKIDKTLFNDAAFNNLVDNTVVLEPSTTGRENPFSPIEGDFSAAPAPLVVTNPPAQITNKTAVLNGTTNNAQGVSSVYFEYGNSPLLGKSTPPAKQSLIGSFGSSIAGLTSGTAYFYRAVAKVNGVIKYGEIISFNTN